MLSGGQWLGSFEFPSGFLEVGVISLSYPNRRKSVPPSADLEGQGRGPLGGGGSPVLGTVYLFCGFLHCQRNPSPWLLSPPSTKEITLEDVILSLVEIGAVNLAPLPSPGFYSRLFVVQKTSGSWSPVIDLSVFIRFVLKTSFKRETGQSVRLSVRQGNWMVSVDLKEAYLQVPVHQDSRKYLRFVTLSEPYQFRALNLGLSTAPQVFTRVMTPISHSHQYRHSYASIPRRLVYSSQLSRGSSPGSQYCSLSLSGVGGCSKPGMNRTSPQLIRFNIYVQFSMPRLSGLLRPGNASTSLCLSTTYFCPPGCLF